MRCGYPFQEAVGLCDWGGVTRTQSGPQAFAERACRSRTPGPLWGGVRRIRGESLLGWPCKGYAAHKHKYGVGAQVHLFNCACRCRGRPRCTSGTSAATSKQKTTRNKATVGWRRASYMSWQPSPPLCRGVSKQMGSKVDPLARPQTQKGTSYRGVGSADTTRRAPRPPRWTGQTGRSSRPPSRLPHGGEDAEVDDRTRNGGQPVGMSTRGTDAPTKTTLRVHVTAGPAGVKVTPAPQGNHRQGRS